MGLMRGFAACEEFGKRLFRGPISAPITFASWFRESFKP